MIYLAVRPVAKPSGMSTASVMVCHQCRKMLSGSGGGGTVLCSLECLVEYMTEYDPEWLEQTPRPRP